MLTPSVTLAMNLLVVSVVSYGEVGTGRGVVKCGMRPTRSTRWRTKTPIHVYETSNQHAC